MVQPPSYTPFSSSNDNNTFEDAINSSSHPKSSSLKRARGRPIGSKNKPKLTLVINPKSEHAQKPIFIQIPRNSDIIEALVRFARDYQISITVQSASGSILNAILRDSQSGTSTFVVHGPFTLVSLTGTYINNNPYAASLSSSLDLDCSFNISFCSNLGQSFMEVVGGKVIAGDDVVATATIFNDS